MLHKDEWLSRYFKGGAYVYSNSKLVQNDQLPEGFVFSKVPLEDLVEVNHLILNGFRLIEVSVFFEQKKLMPYQEYQDLDIGFVHEEEEPGVIEIAKNAFLSSRFYRDQYIEKRIAQQIKMDWVKSFFSKQRGDGMIVARINQQLVGFLLLINHTTIDLIAVSSQHYRKAIASSMIAFANQKIGLLQAGTQLNNQASIALYGKCGFVLKKSNFVFHRMVQ